MTPRPERLEAVGRTIQLAWTLQGPRGTRITVTGEHAEADARLLGRLLTLAEALANPTGGDA